ncbi:MAG TPA: peptidoglycan bridge formation glycyltransferase FemA/FemB family protein, partial [Chloroflexota bacterium]|nr:peptidoglycan bridge formation glycyltransferase FemA/FemB family protein [Chloroflexota bacterium]
MTLELRGWNDQPSWDAFVGSQVNGHVNQGWAWGELAGPLGGRTHRYAVVEDGSIRAAISIISNPIHRIGRRQLFLSRGPAVDNPTRQIFGLIDEALRSAAERENAIVAKVEPFVAAGDHVWQNLLRASGFTPLYPSSQPRSIWALDLQPDLDDLLAGMKPKWRYNIRLAAKRGVEIVRATEAEFEDFYRLYVETARRDHFYIHDAPLYRTIFRAFRDLGQFELLIARYQGEPIAAVT